MKEPEKKPSGDKSLERRLQELESRVETSPRPVPITGRTPWDALAEILGDLFRLLGQWTAPIVILAGLGAAYYFFEDQNQKREAEYNASLEKLRAERDDAYTRISEFNESIADVSAKQITNLTNAFDGLTAINTELSNRRDAVFNMQRDAQAAEAARDEALEAQAQAEAAQRQAEASVQEARTSLETTSRQLEDTRTELDAQAAILADSQRELRDAQAALAEQQATATREIEAGQAELAESQERLEAIEKDLETRADDLSRRAGTIGDLQDTLRAYQSATQAYVEALETYRRDAERQLEADALPPYLADDIQAALSAFEAQSQAVLDAAVDATQLFEQLAAFDGWVEFSAKWLEPLVGVSKSRFMELMAADNGFGFDFWLELRDIEDEDFILLGIAARETRLRLVALDLTSDDPQSRIADTYVADAFPAILSIDPAAPWERAAYLFGFDGEEFTQEIHAELSISETGDISVGEIVCSQDPDNCSSVLIFGDTDQISTMGPDRVEDMILSAGLSLSQQIEAQDYLGLPVAIEAERAAGATAWRGVLGKVADEDLRAEIESLFEAGLAIVTGDSDASVPALDTGMDLDLIGALAAAALMPDLDIDVLSGLPDTLNAEPSDMETAIVTITAAGFVFHELNFKRSAEGAPWEIESYNFDWSR